jgi:hypothetical protein
VLDIFVAQISVQRPRIVALVGQRKATGMAQHVRVSLKADLGRLLQRIRIRCQRLRRFQFLGKGIAVADCDVEQRRSGVGLLRPCSSPSVHPERLGRRLRRGR